MAIAEFWDGSGEPLFPHKPLVASVRSGKPLYSYAFRADQLRTVGLAHSAFVTMYPGTPLMELRGASRGTFEQRVRLAATYPESPTITIVNALSLPYRFDDVRPMSEGGTAVLSLYSGRREVSETVKYVDNKSMGAVGDLDRIKSGSFVAVDATDEDMKRVEDFVVFIAAATFGVAVGGLYELARRLAS